MQIAIAQLNYTIGDFEGNKAKIIENIEISAKKGAKLVIFSELAVCGAPPIDLIKDNSFIDKSLQTLKEIATHCRRIAAIVGVPSFNSEKEKRVINSAWLLLNGKAMPVVQKEFLINDLNQYSIGTVGLNETNFAIAINEDIYETDFFKKLSHYKHKKSKFQSNNILEQCPDCLINITATPFSYDTFDEKEELICKKAAASRLPIIYVNQVGANSEFIFHGGSMVINDRGKIIQHLKTFKEQLLFIYTEEFDSQEIYYDSENPMILIHDALILGIKDFFRKSGFKKAVLGLSGGIDSALVAALAVRALGKENVHGLLLPSKYSSDHSITDAVALAKNLGMSYDIIPINDVFEKIEKTLSPVFEGQQPDVTEENIQARIRAMILMAYSNKYGHILLNTSNKSEGAMGYGTLYGDLCGSLSVIGDVYKTNIYKVANYINSEKEIIPENTIKKAPSAELRPNQKDSDSLPDYKILDHVLFLYLEVNRSVKEIIKQGFDETVVKRIISMLQNSEYKRFQFAPILKVSSKSLGLRKMPLVAKY